MTRTCDLRFRKPSLYPAELRDRIDCVQDFQSKNFGCFWPRDFDRTCFAAIHDFLLARRAANNCDCQWPPTSTFAAQDLDEGWLAEDSVNRGQLTGPIDDVEPELRQAALLRKLARQLAGQQPRIDTAAAQHQTDRSAAEARLVIKHRRQAGRLPLRVFSIAMRRLSACGMRRHCPNG
jgi:hypothetical protein